MILNQTRPRRALTRRVLLFMLIPSTSALVLLAVLRPEAKAQAASTAAPPAGLVTAAHHGESRSVSSRVRQVTAPRNLISPIPPDNASRPQPALLVGAAPLVQSQAPPPLKPASATPAEAPVPVAQGPSATAPAAPPAAMSPSPLAPEASADRPQAVRTGDVTVELAGVTDPDTPGGPWWSDTGALLPTLIFDTRTRKVEEPAAGQS